MKSIIIGAGNMGFSIAQLLSAAEHDVTVVEIQMDRQKIIDDTLDVQTVLGSGVSSKVLESAGIDTADMLLAVTESDELNMIACLIAKQYNVKTTVARVRNTDYMESTCFVMEKLMGIDLILNPEKITAREIAEIVKNPEALNVSYYANDKVQLIELAIKNDSKIAGKLVKELDNSTPYNIVSIIRQHKTIIPRGDDKIYPGDCINIIAKYSEMTQVKKNLGFIKKKIENVTILGGGRTGYHLAKILEQQKPSISSIKIIEKDITRAQEISELLQHTLVIHGDGSDYELLANENINNSDIFIAVSDDDQINLLCALIAKSLGVPKVIVQVKRVDLMHLAEQIGIDVTLSPRLLTSGAILKYIRRGDIISVTLMNEESAEMIELLAQPSSFAINKTIKDIKFPIGSVLGAIVRCEKVIIPDGEVRIQTFDRLIIFCLPESIYKVEKLFLGKSK